MSKHCEHHKERRQLLRHIFAGILTFILLILLIIFLIWIILRPTKPRFILEDATVFAFNLSSTGTEPSPSAPTPNTLTTTMQVTISAFNPNSRISIYFQNIHAYASYRGQQISLDTKIPDTYQGHHDVAVWSPFLYGISVPVSPYVLDSLQQDQIAGGTLVNVKVNGRVKWKVGSWVSGRYHIAVNCPAFIKVTCDKDNVIGVAAPSVKVQLVQSCAVDV